MGSRHQNPEGRKSPIRNSRAAPLIASSSFSSAVCHTPGRPGSADNGAQETGRPDCRSWVSGVPVRAGDKARVGNEDAVRSASGSALQQRRVLGEEGRQGPVARSPESVCVPTRKEASAGRVAVRPGPTEVND